MHNDLLQQIADKQEITEVIYKYCRSMDRIDYELGYSIWNEGAVADYGPNIFQGSGRGYIDQCLAQHEGLLSHSHNITNILIRLDGNKAGSESYCIASIRYPVDGALKEVTVWTRYIDTWSRQNGRWGIDKRVTIRDHDDFRDVVPMSDDKIGRRDKTDPSYAALMDG